MQYLKTMIIFKNFCEKETFNPTIRFAFEKLLKKWDPQSVKVCTGAPTDEIKTLKLTISTLRIYSFFHFQFTSSALIASLPKYRYGT